MIVLLTRFGPVPDPTAVSDSVIVTYGIAAPFALLCLALAWLFRKERDQARAEATAECDKKDIEITRLHARIEEQQKEALQREQQLVAGLGPRIYDAALLYREATGLAEQVSVAPVPPPAAPPAIDRRLDDLAAAVERLVEGMGRDPGT